MNCWHFLNSIQFLVALKVLKTKFTYDKELSNYFWFSLPNSSFGLFLHTISKNRLEQSSTKIPKSNIVKKKLFLCPIAWILFCLRRSRRWDQTRLSRQRFVTNIVNKATSHKIVETQLNDGHNLPMDFTLTFEANAKCNNINHVCSHS